MALNIWKVRAYKDELVKAKFGFAYNWKTIRTEIFVLAYDEMDACEKAETILSDTGFVPMHAVIAN